MSRTPGPVSRHGYWWCLRSDPPAAPHAVPHSAPTCLSHRTLKRTKGNQEEAIALLFSKDDFELEMEEATEDENFWQNEDLDENDEVVTLDNEISVRQRGSSPAKKRRPAGKGPRARAARR